MCHFISRCGLAAARAGRRGRPNRPVPIRAFALVCFSVLTDLIAQPRDELLDDRAFGRARRDEHEIRAPVEHRFAAKRCDQQTLAEMASIVRLTSDRDPAAVDRRLDHLVVMRETQRAGRLQFAEFLLRLMYAFTYCAGISRTSCPSAPSSRAQ
jgi:hypothetical protein